MHVMRRLFVTLALLTIVGCLPTRDRIAFEEGNGGGSDAGEDVTTDGATEDDVDPPGDGGGDEDTAPPPDMNGGGDGSGAVHSERGRLRIADGYRQLRTEPYSGVWELRRGWNRMRAEQLRRDQLQRHAGQRPVGRRRLRRSELSWRGMSGGFRQSVSARWKLFVTDRET